MSKLMDFSTVATLRDLTDIESMPGYVVTVDPQRSRPTDVIDEYRFRCLVKCGIGSCRQPHLHGLVILTDDGLLTNIGHDCGVTHFGNDFTVLRNRRIAAIRGEREIAYLLQRKQAGLEISRSLEVSGEVGGVVWMCEAMREFERVFPVGPLRRLLNQARNGNSKLSISRQRTRDEVERLLAVNSKARRSELQYESVVLGSVPGLSCLSPDPRTELNLLRKQLDLLWVEPSALTNKERSTLVQATHGMEARYESLCKSASSATQFFQYETLILLRKWIEAEKHGEAERLAFDSRLQMITKRSS